MAFQSRFNRIVALIIVGVIVFTTPLWPVGIVLIGWAGIGWLKRRNTRRH